MDVQSASALLAQAGLGVDVREIRALAQGGNNRTWLVEAGDERYVVKQYFQHADDKRNRLQAEFDFTRYAGRVVPESVPQALVMSAQDGLAAYAFVAGEVIRAGQVAQTDVDAAARFFAALNDPRHLELAQDLPEASEACFALSEHLSLIARRIELLRDATRSDGMAHAFVELMAERWLEISGEVLRGARIAGIAADVALPREQCCVSPSDFGFHNALRDDGGSVRFLDFEYAGWDDPAKMVGDFFAQLAVPVPAEYFDYFARATLAQFPNADQLFARAALLRPVYQIKWCCIALNVFLPVNLARRKFANPDLDESALKRAQLTKAQILFQSLEPVRHGLH